MQAKFAVEISYTKINFKNSKPPCLINKTNIFDIFSGQIVLKQKLLSFAKKSVSTTK